jgi:outer membrane protein OmpA-like peptidoglycan-associated protein
MSSGVVLGHLPVADLSEPIYGFGTPLILCCPYPAPTTQSSWEKMKISTLIASFIVSLNIANTHANEFGGGHWGGGIGLSNFSPDQKTGWLGVQGGYNWEIGNWVAGIGGYVDWDRRSPQSADMVYGSYALGVDGRTGLSVGNWLPYAKLGYGYGAGTASYSVVSAFSLNAAVGIEYKISSRWSTFGEYKRYSYGNQAGSITTRKYMMGIAYWFGLPTTPPPKVARTPAAQNIARPITAPVVTAPTATALPGPQPDIIRDLPAEIAQSDAPLPAPTPIVAPPAAAIEPLPAPLLEPVEPPVAPALPAPVPEPVLVPEPAPIPEVVPVPDTLPISKPAPIQAPVEKLIRIEGANFDTASARLKPAAFRQLDEVVALALQQPDAKLDVAGYTDSRDVKKQNKQLSAARAESVKEYLVQKGVSPNRVTTRGEAAAHPIGDNNTEAGRALNRRVEIIFVSNSVEK